MEARVRRRGWKLTRFCTKNKVWRRRSEPERKAVARTAKGSMWTQTRGRRNGGVRARELRGGEGANGQRVPRRDR
eukprot:3668229-Pleurochrysis_carterae.AAC.1